jgi:gamma-glutamylcyclotransferase (GGCT)/AIG2-like uncharacterized protein YtfP
MKTVKLIVYGTLMSGERNHRFCRNAVNINPCTITGTLYDTGYGFPAFVPEGDGVVKAELIEIPIEDWAAVDGLEGYPRLYDRQLYPAKIADGTEFSGWVYIMNTLPPMATVIESGSWKEYRHG